MIRHKIDALERKTQALRRARRPFRIVYHHENDGHEEIVPVCDGEGEPEELVFNIVYTPKPTPAELAHAAPAPSSSSATTARATPKARRPIEDMSDDEVAREVAELEAELRAKGKTP